MKHPHGSWLALVTFCVVTAVTAALGFGVLLAGSSVVFAVAQSPQISNETVPVAIAQLPQVSDDTVSRDADEQEKAAAAQASQLSPVKVDGHREAASGKTFSGMITDSHCGARHSMDSGKTSAECARSCVRNGSRYLLVDGEVIHALEGNPAQLDKLAGERVEVVGLLEGDTIKVRSVATR